MIITAIVNAIVFAGPSRVICGLAVMYHETGVILGGFSYYGREQNKKSVRSSWFSLLELQPDKYSGLRTYATKSQLAHSKTLNDKFAPFLYDNFSQLGKFTGNVQKSVF
jgi:hypothetical protein